MARPARRKATKKAAESLSATAAAREAKRLVDEVWQDMKKWGANYGRARRLLEAAAKTEPKNSLVLTALGTVLSDIGQHRRAFEVLQKAMLLGADDRHTAFNMAVALMNGQRHDRAMRYFKKAAGLKVRPGTWEAYFDPHGH